MSVKKILFLAAGGTICCKQTQEGLAPAYGFEKLLSGGMDKTDMESMEICGEQVFMLDSSDMTYRHWTALAKRITERYDEFDGFVVSHGTDTLGYAAAAMSCLIENSKKPVAMTGSMLPPDDENTDAFSNLRGAFAYAAAEGAFGVKVVFGGRIIDGECAVKVHSGDKDAFRSVNRPQFGSFDGGAVRFSGRHSGEERFYGELCGGVYLAKLIPGQRLSVPKSEGLRAVVVESFGAGGVPCYIEDDVARLCAEGIYVIIASQALCGGTALSRYKVGWSALSRYPIIETGKYTIEYAVARAQRALARSDSFEEFRNQFIVDS